MKLEGRQNREPYTKSKLKKIFTSWHIYLLTLLYMWVEYLINLERKYSPDLRCFNNGAAGSQPIFQQWVISGYHHRETYSDTWQVPQKLKRSCIFNQPDQFDTNHHSRGPSRDNPRLRVDIGYYPERQPLAPSHLRCCEYNTPCRNIDKF